MKKRLLSIILVLTMIASLSACNFNFGDAGDDHNIIGTQQENDTKEDSETEGTEMLPTETEGTESNQTDIGEPETDTNQTESSQDGNKDQNDNNNQDNTNDLDNTDASGNGGGSVNADSSDSSESNGDTGSNDNADPGDSGGSNGDIGANGNSGSNGDAGAGDSTGSGGNSDTSIETQYIAMFTKEENDLADAVIAGIIRSSMGEFAKVKAIHDYLLMNVDYDYKNYMNGTVPQVSHTVKGALSNRYAVCDGYAQAFRLLCLKVGISCEFVTGTSKGESHAWNQVKIEGNWYNIDVTWDDPMMINGTVTTFDDHSGNSYDYFCVPDSIFNKDHTANNAKYTCTSPGLFERALKAGIPWENVKYVTSESELVAWIQSEVQKGNSSPRFYIKASVIGDDLGQYCMDRVKKAGIKCSVISLDYFTYFEGTTDPGTYYKIIMTIQYNK